LLPLAHLKLLALFNKLSFRSKKQYFNIFYKQAYNFSLKYLVKFIILTIYPIGILVRHVNYTLSKQSTHSCWKYIVLTSKEMGSRQNIPISIYRTNGWISGKMLVMFVLKISLWLTLYIPQLEAIVFPLSYCDHSTGNQRLFQAKTMGMSQRSPLVLIELV